MKARITRQPEKLLLIGLNDETKQRALAAAAQMKMDCEWIGPARLGQTVAALAGLEPEKSDVPELQPPAQAMVISGADSTRLSRLLRLLRQAGLGDIPKAVVTPTNRSWTAAALAEQADKEHRQMHGTQDNPER